MARVTAIQWYYQVIFLVFLFLTGYTAVFSSEYSADECYKVEPVEGEAAPDPTGNLTVVPDILVLGYVLELLLCFLMIIGTYYFSNLDVGKFASLNLCQRFLGMLTKLLPFLIVLAHWIVFVLLFVQSVFVLVVANCKNAVHVDSETHEEEEGQMQSQAEVHLIVCGLTWLALHTCGAFARRNLYTDAFFYQPDMPDEKFKNFCCVQLGP